VKRLGRPSIRADRAEGEPWSVRMWATGGPAQPSPTIGQCISGDLGWLEVECNRCKTRARLHYAPPVHMIKLTEMRESRQMGAP
jgi:hypothetical protein